MNYTPKQLQIMRFLRDYQLEHGTCPTLEEIGQALGVHRVTVHQHVAALDKKGAIRKLAQRSRSIEITDPDYLPRSNNTLRTQEGVTFEVKCLSEEPLPEGVWLFVEPAS